MAKPMTKIRTVNDRHSTGKEKKKKELSMKLKIVTAGPRCQFVLNA